MRKNQTKSQLLQCFNLRQAKSKMPCLDGFCFDAEVNGRDFLAKPMMPLYGPDVFALGVKFQNLFGNRHRGCQTRRFNSKKVC